jgi:hypothetical protein
MTAGKKAEIISDGKSPLGAVVNLEPNPAGGGGKGIWA